MPLQDPDDELSRLQPDTRRAVNQLVRSAPELLMRVRSGRRTCEEQYDLYGVGRRYNIGKPVVTHARGCRSWHVLGQAVDLDILNPDTGRPVGSCDPYRLLGQIWEEMGGVWGGRWTSYGPCGDQGHFEWHPGQTIEEVCPDPDRCEEVEAAIDAAIAQANFRQSLVVGGTVFAVVLGGIAGAWYILHHPADSWT